ncbi:sigma-70 family RNA polymerase sigma factor, partial [bacterium]|nr:sigma-70 family RNA polymerase sigma factor [bacterium]
PIQVIWGLDKNLVKLAGKYKSRYKISFADSFVLALAEKEKSVLTHYYYEGLSLKEIGSVLSLTESRISQLHTKAILKLRKTFQSWVTEI